MRDVSLSTHWDEKFKCNVVNILSGDFYVSNHAEVICTILGSCISACIYDKEKRIGGMNHFILPEQLCSHQSQNIEVLENSYASRYGAVSMERMINELVKQGGNMHNMQAKIFGGANIINAMSVTNDIGKKNTDFVRNYLKLENIPVLSEDVGGNHPRKVYFFSDSNDVYVKKTGNFHLRELIKSEHKYQRYLNTTIEEADIEIFT